jgi:hypothetical protein
MGEGEAAIFLRPEKFRDEKPDREIEQNVAEEGEKYGHGGVRAGLVAGAPRRDGAREEKSMKVAAILLRRKPVDKQAPGRAEAWRSVALASNHPTNRQGDCPWFEPFSRAPLAVRGGLPPFPIALRPRAGRRAKD